MGTEDCFAFFRTLLDLAEPDEPRHIHPTCTPTGRLSVKRVGGPRGRPGSGSGARPMRHPIAAPRRQHGWGHGGARAGAVTEPYSATGTTGELAVPLTVSDVVGWRCVHDEAHVEAASRSALAAGDRERALHILLEAYREPLFRYCRRQLGDREAAKDVLQTVFLQAFEALRGAAPSHALRAWLFVIARNRCIDTLRIHARSRRFMEASEEEALQDPAQSRLPETLALSFCLSRLSPASRETLLLSHEGFTYSELSEMLGGQPSALAMRVHRALVALRICLRTHGGGR